MEKRQSDNNLLKSLEDQLQCRICSAFYNNCVMTACGHNFCSACIKQVLSNDEDCPNCFEVIRESDLRSNKLMDKLARFYKKMQKDKSNGSSNMANQRKANQKSSHTDSGIRLVSVQSSSQVSVNSPSSSYSQNSNSVHYIQPALTDSIYPVKLEVVECNEVDMNDVVMCTNSAEESFETEDQLNEKTGDKQGHRQVSCMNSAANINAVQRVKKKMFHVVEFQSCNSVAIVPDNWLLDLKADTSSPGKVMGLCYWPPTKNLSKLNKSVKAGENPQSMWEVFPIRSLGAYEHYADARGHLKQAEGISDLQLNEKRRVRRPKRYESDSSGEDASQSVISKRSRLAKAPEVPAWNHPPAPQHSQPEQHMSANYLQFPSTTSSMADFSNILEQTQYSAQSAGDCSCNTPALLGLIMDIQKQLSDLSEFVHGHQKKDFFLKRTLPEDFPVAVPILEAWHFEPLEVYLQDDENFTKSLPYFSLIGGRNQKDILRRLLESLIGHVVALKTNWKGRHGKCAMERFPRVVGLIYHAALTHIPKLTLSEVESFLKEWLKSSHDRCGGRDARQKKNL